MKLPSLIVLFAGLAADFAWSAADLAVPDSVQFERGLEYANPDQQHLQLNLARPKTGHGPFPAVVCIHGGGFRAGTREGYDQLCVTLAQNGYVAATITYRLSPAYRFPAAVHDSKAAVRWLRANAARYQIDPKRIGATGGSAGGHLALFLGVTEGVKAFEGEGNLYVAYEQAVWMVDRLKACAVEASLFTLEGAGHGFKGADAQKADQAMLAFFAKHLKP